MTMTTAQKTRLIKTVQVGATYNGPAGLCTVIGTQEFQVYYMMGVGKTFADSHKGLKIVDVRYFAKEYKLA